MVPRVLGSRLNPSRFRAIVATLVLLCGLVVFVPSGAQAATCDITDISNAIVTANGNAPQATTISLTADCTYTFDGPNTFTDSDDSQSALPELSGHLIVTGNGATINRSDTAPEARIFSIAATGNLELDNVTISGGTAENGGGIMNFGGQLTLTNSWVTENSAQGGFGGGIASLGTTVIRASTVSSNSGTIGGGIANIGGSMTIDSSTISINTSDFGPAEIYNSGPTLGDGTLTLVNSTIAGIEGGVSDIGVVNIGTFNAYNSTIVFNSGGGINNQGGSAGSPSVTTLVNTIVANNGTAGCDSSQTSVGGIVDGGHNLDSGNTCGFSAANGSLLNTDPQFSPAGLSFQGGPTQVMPLAASSPAVNAGDDTVCAASLVNGLDQRGLARPQGAHCDIGSFELMVPVVTPANASAQDSDSSVTLSAAVEFDCGASFANCPTMVNGTVTFSVTDASNNEVLTPVTGTVASNSAAVTFDPSSLALGSYTITATYHDPTGTYPDSFGTGTLTITIGSAASVTLSPGNTSAAVGQTVTEIATVLDAENVPVVDGTVVQYSVTGSNPTSGSVTTVNGQATITYSGSFAGTDTLTVTVLDGSQPSTSATIVWNAPASTSRASLTIMSFGSPQIQALVTTGAQGGVPSGTFSYSDRTVRLSQAHLLSLVASGSNATLFGTANLSDGSTVSFRLDVSASRVGGTLRLQLSNDYDSGRFSAPIVRITP